MGSKVIECNKPWTITNQEDFLNQLYDNDIGRFICLNGNDVVNWNKFILTMLPELIKFNNITPKLVSDMGFEYPLSIVIKFEYNAARIRSEEPKHYCRTIHKRWASSYNEYNIEDYIVGKLGIKYAGPIPFDLYTTKNRQIDTVKTYKENLKNS